MSKAIEDKKAIHIAIAFDKNYVRLCLIFLASLFKSNKGNQLVLHAIATDVTPEQKAAISAYANGHGHQIVFYDIKPADLEGLVIHKDSHLTVATYYRLFFPALIPAGIDKLIYTDVDIININSLSELYNIDLGTKPVGAVMDAVTRPRPVLGITEESNYFNAGVLLINVPEWKAQKVTERVMQFVYENPDKLRLGDQDALNAVLKNNWFCLDGKYNVTTLDIPKDLPRKQYKTFLSDKVNIHYTMGKHKPWRFLNKNKFRFLYYEYLKLAPVDDKRKYIDFSMSPLKLYRFFKIRTAERLMGYPGMYKIAKKIKLVE